MSGKRLAALFVGMLALASCRGGDGAAPQQDAGGIKVDFGVTKEACPQAVDKAKGCIYLGTISDLTEGPFKTLAVPITDAQKADRKSVV